MSTPRFPRTRLYRDLARLEAEVRGWYEHFDQLAQRALTEADAEQYQQRADQCYELARLIHYAADFAGGVPRLRTVWGKVQQSLM